MLLVIGLSCLAAFLFALAASLQQHEARRAARSGVRRRVSLVGLARSLPRSRLWLFGWAVNLAGFVAQGTALYFGSIALVQVVLVTQLIPDGMDVLACGPQPMLEAVGAVAPTAQLAWEAPMACGYGACYGCAVEIDGVLKRLCVEGPVLRAA